MNLEKYILNKKKDVEIIKKNLREKEAEISNFSKSLRYFSKRGLDVSVLRKNGRDFYVVDDVSFYPMVRGYSIQNSHEIYGQDFSDDKGFSANYFFQWKLLNSHFSPPIMNKEDFDFMKIYSVSEDDSLRDSGHYISRMITKEVNHGKSISEIINYFLNKGVSTRVLLNLERDIVELRNKNPIKIEKDRGCDL